MRTPRPPAESRRKRHMPDWEPSIPGRRRVLKTWGEYMAMAKRIIERFDHQFDLRHFEYHHPVRLQKCLPRFRKPYPVKVAYTDWGDPASPIVVCVGGVANTAMRFSYLASDLESHFRVVCMDWVGRGRSGWMADERDYSLATYTELIRSPFVRRRLPILAAAAREVGGVQVQNRGTIGGNISTSSGIDSVTVSGGSIGNGRQYFDRSRHASRLSPYII